MAEPKEPKPIGSYPGEEGYVETDSNEGGDLSLPRFMVEGTEAVEPTEPKIEKRVSIEEWLSSLRMWIDTIDHFQKTHELTEEQKTIAEKGLHDTNDQIAILLNQVVDWSKTAKRKQT